MITEFIKIAQGLAAAAGYAQRAAEAKVDADIWGMMYQPIIDSATDPQEKARLEALSYAVALRIMFGPENFQKLRENRDSVEMMLSVISKLPGKSGREAMTAFTGSGLRDYEVVNGKELFNATADALYGQFLVAKAELTRKGYQEKHMAGEGAVYASTTEDIAVAECDYEMMLRQKGSTAFTSRAGKAQTEAMRTKKGTVESNIRTEKEVITTSLTQGNPREQLNRSLDDYLRAKKQDVKPITLLFGPNRIMFAPKSMVAHWRNYNTITLGLQSAAKAKQAVPSPRAGVARLPENRKNSLEREANQLRNVNDSWNNMDTFFAAPDGAFKKTRFPIGSESKEYEAVLLLASYAVVLYEKAGRSDELKGMNIYRLASLVRWEDIKDKDTLRMKSNNLGQYFNQDQMADFDRSLLDKKDFPNEHALIALVSKCGMHATEFERYEEMKALFQEMKPHFESEEDYLLKLIGDSSLELASGRIPKSEQKAVSEHIGSMARSLLELRRHRLGNVEVSIKDLVDAQMQGSCSYDQREAIARQLDQSMNLPSPKLAANVARPKILGITELEGQKNDVGGRIGDIEKRKALIGSVVLKDLLLIHKRLGEKLERYNNESVASSAKQSMLAVKGAFRNAAATLRLTAETKDVDTKMSILQSLASCSDSLSTLLSREHHPIDELVTMRVANRYQRETLKNSLATKRGDIDKLRGQIAVQKNAKDETLKSMRNMERGKIENEFKSKIEALKKTELHLGAYSKMSATEKADAKRTAAALAESILKLENEVKGQLATLDERLVEMSTELDAELASLESELGRLEGECLQMEERLVVLETQGKELESEQSLEEHITTLDDNLMVLDSVDVNHRMHDKVMEHLSKEGYPSVDECRTNLQKANIQRVGRDRSPSSDSLDYDDTSPASTASSSSSRPRGGM